jgi:hypothetical protein
MALKPCPMSVSRSCPSSANRAGGANDTGFEENLYTVEGGDDPQIIEKRFFSNVDN